MRNPPNTSWNGVSSGSVEDAAYMGDKRLWPRCHGLAMELISGCSVEPGSGETTTVEKGCCTTHRCTVCDRTADVLWPR